MSDLFQESSSARRQAVDPTYSAEHIEVLEGLEPVRRRPGMYIGGTDERALHHLAAEIFDNSMDEAVAGHATRIELELAADDLVTIRDNGRGIPVDEHPKYPGRSALEVIFTTLHSGGKFSGKAYETSGGLHGVGSSVVNALSSRLTVEVARDRQLWRQEYSRGEPLTKLENVAAAPNRRGTTIMFQPDPQIFGSEAHFKAERLYRMARSKAYLHRGVEIRWKCDPALIDSGSEIPADETLHFPGGLEDFLLSTMAGEDMITPLPFTGEGKLPGDAGRVEWAMSWPDGGSGFLHSYCNTIPTPEGGTHEQGLRSALTRSLKGYGELTKVAKAQVITADDIVAGAGIILSVFLRDPQFQGQTKERLTSNEAARAVDAVLKDHFDHWLAENASASRALLERIIERADERLRRKNDKEMERKTGGRRLRLPGKLADCSSSSSTGTELFIVEGDSAGGSAKQARRRETQAILPLRGKILNVASASTEKFQGNKELADLILTLGCGTGKSFSLDKLRYERIIIMTDADVDGAHIASLLMTFFWRETRGMIEAGRLYLALPPLYRLTQGTKSIYARDDADRERLMAKLEGKGKVEVSRFKGLGEMPAAQLKETTMDPDKRTLLRVTSDDIPAVDGRVDELMGRNVEPRFRFIQDRAKFAEDSDLDV
jgi:topoisomerase-4 subunit B